MRKIFIALTACILFMATGAFAQTGQPKFKAPRVFATLQNYKDSVVISAEEAKSLLDKTLAFKDDKGVVYKIARYLFVYKKLVSVEREDGSIGTNSTLVAQVFQSSPLPELWVNNIRLDLKSGEELLFTDIILTAPGGQNFYAKQLKIVIK